MNPLDNKRIVHNTIESNKNIIKYKLIRPRMNERADILQRIKNGGASEIRWRSCPVILNSDALR
jgi:hypothetical protein